MQWGSEKEVKEKGRTEKETLEWKERERRIKNHSLNSAALSDPIVTHHPDLFCLTETWIKNSTTCTELTHCILHLTSLHFSEHPYLF